MSRTISIAANATVERRKTQYVIEIRPDEESGKTALVCKYAKSFARGMSLFSEYSRRPGHVISFNINGIQFLTTERVGINV